MTVMLLSFRRQKGLQGFNDTYPVIKAFMSEIFSSSWKNKKRQSEEQIMCVLDD